MNYPAEKVDSVSVERATSFARSYERSILRKAEALRTDSDAENRKNRSLCRACHYLRSERIGGSAITTRPCGICGKTMSFSNTCTDVVCLDCAKEHKLCAHCGGDAEMRARRKFSRVSEAPPQHG